MTQELEITVTEVDVRAAIDEALEAYSKLFYGDLPRRITAERVDAAWEIEITD